PRTGFQVASVHSIFELFAITQRPDSSVPVLILRLLLYFHAGENEPCPRTASYQLIQRRWMSTPCMPILPARTGRKGFHETSSQSRSKAPSVLAYSTDHGRSDLHG